MTVSIREQSGGRLIELRLSDRLTRDEYDQLVPELEVRIEQHGSIRMLVLMEDFHGSQLGVLWEETKFSLQHFRDIDRVAMVGDRSWEKWMAAFSRPFTLAEIRYFDISHIGAAREWLAGYEPGRF